MPRRKLTKLESLRVSKMFWELLMMQGERMRWMYWEIPLDALQEMATRYNIGQLMDWVDPYARGLNVMKVFLKTITSYLSNGNLETPLDEWLQDPAEGDKIQERLDLILVMEDPDNSCMGAMKKMANLLLSVCEYTDVKIGLADKVIAAFNEYLACDAKLLN